MQLVELQRVVDRVQKAGWSIAAVTYDEPAVLRTFAADKGISYPLFAGRALIQTLGLTDPRFAMDEKRAGVPVPVVLITDSRGAVVQRFFEDDRWALTSILARVAAVEAPAGATWVRGAQVDVRAWTPSATARAGQRISLAADLRPHAGMHVYAPGTHSYTPVSVRLTDSAAIEALGLAFPPSEQYTFVPLNETVPVYKSAVTLFQDIHVPPNTPAGRLVIRGVLTSQACDADLCYPAERSVLTWRITIEPAPQ